MYIYIYIYMYYDIYIYIYVYIYTHMYKHLGIGDLEAGRGQERAHAWAPRRGVVISSFK